MNAWISAIIFSVLPCISVLFAVIVFCFWSFRAMDCPLNSWLQKNTKLCSCTGWGRPTSLNDHSTAKSLVCFCAARESPRGQLSALFISREKLSFKVQKSITLWTTTFSNFLCSNLKFNRFRVIDWCSYCVYSITVHFNLPQWNIKY